MVGSVGRFTIYSLVVAQLGLGFAGCEELPGSCARTGETSRQRAPRPAARVGIDGIFDTLFSPKI